MHLRLIALGFLSVLLACSRVGNPLPGLGIDVDETSVSGLSAGAYMAGQLQVAHSKQIVGAGIVAGGPFGCAASQAESFLAIAQNLSQAFEDCLNGHGIPDATALVERAKELAKGGEVDPLADLSKDRVYLFSGGEDRIVARSVVEATERFYIEAGIPQGNIGLMTREDAGHSILTTDTGNACGLSESPFVSDCDYDQAGAILKWIYGDLNAPAERPAGKFLVFAQSRYAEGFGNGLSSEGVIYIPETCAAKGGCRLHIALHGCEQNRDQVGMAFIEGSGFAGWADTNNLVILFPQVEASILNPKGCWDWWGYTGKNFLTKDALQIAAIWRMVERLAGERTANAPAAFLQHSVSNGKRPGVRMERADLATLHREQTVALIDLAQSLGRLGGISLPVGFGIPCPTPAALTERLRQPHRSNWGRPPIPALVKFAPKANISGDGCNPHHWC